MITQNFYVKQNDHIYSMMDQQNLPCNVNAFQLWNNNKISHSSLVCIQIKKYNQIRINKEKMR